MYNLGSLLPSPSFSNASLSPLVVFPMFKVLNGVKELSAKPKELFTKADVSEEIRLRCTCELGKFYIRTLHPTKHSNSRHFFPINM